MEEQNTPIFSQAKLEYTNQLIDTLTPHFFDGIKSIYDEAKTVNNVNKTQSITLLDIANAMESWAPLDTAEPWDNCGIQLGDRGADVNSVLLSLDIDSDVLSYLESVLKV